MAYYRIYCLDGASRFVTAEEVEADTDEEALKIASGMRIGVRREVWQRARRVGTIETDPGHWALNLPKLCFPVPCIFPCAA